MDTSKSLQELENDDWGDPHGPTGMVIRCMRLRRVPVRDLTADDCRLLLGQEIGVRFVLPVALDYLFKNPLESGIGDTGALMRRVLELPTAFWQNHPNLWWEAKEVLMEVENARNAIEELMPKIREFEAMDVS